ncbi:MAG TPA: hypothetical protein VFU68_07685 [Terracidiphilus sp.]|nr:hypothetical protein [Terracidiphilus sp.]
MHRLHFALIFAATALLVPAASASAQSTNPSSAPAAQAPVPPAMAAAKTVFLSNGGASPALFPSSNSELEWNGPYSGTPRRGYDEFYAALAKSGRFQLVNSPSSADLVLQLQLTTPVIPIPRAVPNPELALPTLHLVIYDRASHYVLWVLNLPIHPAVLKKTADRNFDAAVHSLAKQLLDLAGSVPATAP